jgi:hypothetical protein
MSTWPERHFLDPTQEVLRAQGDSHRADEARVNVCSVPRFLLVNIMVSTPGSTLLEA